MHGIDDLVVSARTSKRAIRLWEKKGLLGVVARDDLGRRVYDEPQLRRAQVIAAAQMAGMSLAEIKNTHELNINGPLADAVEFMEHVMNLISRDFDL